MNSIKDDVKALCKDIQDLKLSLEFSQKDISDLQKNMEKIERKVEAQSTIQKESQAMLQDSFEEVYDQVEYLENQSRRNNIKIIGLAENRNEHSWEDTEKLVKETIRDKLGIQEELLIERAHRVGKSNASTQIGKPKTRKIVAKFRSWKQKEKILKIAREKRVDGLFSSLISLSAHGISVQTRFHKCWRQGHRESCILHARSTHYQRQPT